jgi:hypothetical protein
VACTTLLFEDVTKCNSLGNRPCACKIIQDLTWQPARLPRVHMQTSCRIKDAYICYCSIIIIIPIIILLLLLLLTTTTTTNNNHYCNHHHHYTRNCLLVVLVPNYHVNWSSENGVDTDKLKSSLMSCYILISMFNHTVKL